MSDFNRRGKLPFQIISSSVNTGYNAELTAAVGRNFEIVNQHTDEYGELQDSPAQGPFTEQWVGGNQHRHIDLNTGSDNSANRPEAFLISGSSNKIRVYGPTHFNTNAPKALLTRDNIAKSPVNIKNIRNESRRLGNFSHNYQVVQTSGRDINQSLIENNLTASGVLTTKFITIPDYYLYNRKNYITSSGDGNPTGDNFGLVISVSGDSNTLLASSPGSDILGTTAGAVSVFKKNTNLEWYEEAFLTSSGDGNPAYDRLGNSIAINYDGTIIAAGFVPQTPPSTNDGSVVIFRSSSLGWNQESILVSGIGSDIDFASRIHINELGNVVVVGAPDYNVPSTSGGGVFVYKSSSLGWSLEQTLTSSTGVVFRKMGADVKVNFDGTKIAAGGRFRNCVIMFESGSSGWYETAYLTSSASDLQFLGFQLALNRDFDTMIAGASVSGIDGVLDGQGKAVLFTSSSLNGWIEEKVFLPPEPGTNFYFGSSVDINTDGNFILIASQGYTGSYTQNTGAVYLYNNLAGHWQQESIIVHDSSSFAYALIASVKTAENGNKIYINCVSSSVLEFDRILIPENNSYSLPDVTPSNKTVFVERFSAPGGKEESSRGVLDRESEQYSPNNSLVTRNIKVRQPYYSELTRHNKKFYLNEQVPSALEFNYSLFDSFYIGGQESFPEGFYFKEDGKEFYIIGKNSDSIFRFGLSIAFEISTAYFINSRSILTQTSEASGITFSPDGTKMFIVSNALLGDRRVYKYNLSTPWDITDGSCIFDSSYNIGFLATGILFSADGTRMFVCGFSTKSIINEYTLSSNWDISAPTLKTTLDISSRIISVQGMYFDSSGLELFACGNNSFVESVIVKYSLKEDRNLETAKYDFTIYLSPITEEFSVRDVYITPDKNKMFIKGVVYDTIYQYSLDTEIFGKHSVNKNSFETIKEENGVFMTTYKHDNFWIQHAIPSTDLRYKWIADSIVDSTDIIQYQNLYDSEQLIFNSSSLVISGSNKEFEVDNIGIKSIIKNKKSINLDTNTLNVSSTIGLSASFSEIANTPYGFSTWKQIRNGEHPVARKLRENNVLSLEGTKMKMLSSSETIAISKRSDFVINYTEPPVTNKFKPLKQVLNLKGSNQKYEFTFTHGNNLSTFVHNEVLDYLGITENSQQTYNLLRKYYSDPTRATNTQNPVNKIESYTHSETLYPREVNTYLAETRARLSFSVTSSTSNYTDRDNINIQLGTHRTYWKDSVNDRLRNGVYDFYNSLNYKILKIEGSVLQSGQCLRHNIPNIFTPLYDYETLYQFKNVRLGRSIKEIDINNKSSRQELADVSVKMTQTTLGTDEKIYGIKAGDNGCSGELNYENFLDYFYTSSTTPVKTQLIRVTNYSTLTQFDDRIGTNGTFETYGNFNPEGDYYLTLPVPRPNYTAFLGGFESGSRNYVIEGDVWYDLEKYHFFTDKPNGKILSTLDSGLRYSVESFGDKKPWFDSYEDYCDDIRSYAKDHSILPEFRMSSQIPFYVTQNGGNFRAKNSSFLEIDGIGQNYRSSLTSSNINYNPIFINSYVTTDNLDNENIQRENSNLLKLKNIKFTVSGIKKLLPYNGFYPQERTIQLANLFGDFLDNNIGGGYFKFNRTVNTSTNNIGGEILINITQSADYFYKNTVLPYFFAPGILYNTIKSGISVDFPAILANANRLLSETAINQGIYYFYNSSVSKSKGIQQLGVSGSIMSTNFINARLPFESILFPEKHIPINSVLTSSVYYPYNGGLVESQKADLFFDSIVSGTALCNIKFDSNSRPDVFNTSDQTFGLGWKDATPFAYLRNDKIINPSYSMAMSNFLAEIPRFFLKNGTMNVFKSAELKDWKTFQLGKKYYFDLRMKKSSDLVMVEAYKSNNHVTGTDKIEKTFNGRYFGWPVNKVQSDIRSNYDDLVMHNDPAYAPFTPPYFEGEAILRFELSASKTQYDNVQDLFKDVNLTDIFDDLGRVISGSDAYKNKMSIQDCMEVFGVGQNPIASFNNPNNANSFEQIPNTSKEYWAISPKLETPVLDFSEQKFIEHTGSYWVSSGYGRGMWSGYGKIPTGSKGITIEIAESFPLQNFLRNSINTPGLFNNSKTGSLLDQVGFKAESAKIGQLAETKTISEAIVMIPYVDNPIEGVTIYIDGHHFFSIDPYVFAKLKTQIGLNTVEKETSITNMIRLMSQYVIPPNFDFSTYYKNPTFRTIRDAREGIEPFVMYIFEFKHELDQQDLADIWQGVMPKIATTAEKDTVTFGHSIGENELFGENFTPPENMRWLVFKVKKKAEWNYFAVTENINDDQNFVFKFSNSEEAKTPDYSYNWPYDYFSLVELAKVDISLMYDEKPPISGAVGLEGNRFAIGNEIDYNDIGTYKYKPTRRGKSRISKAKRSSGKNS